MTIIIDFQLTPSFNFERNTDAISIQIAWIGIDLIFKSKAQVFKDMIDEYNKHGF